MSLKETWPSRRTILRLFQGIQHAKVSSCILALSFNVIDSTSCQSGVNRKSVNIVKRECVFFSYQIDNVQRSVLIRERGREEQLILKRKTCNININLYWRAWRSNVCIQSHRVKKSRQRIDTGSEISDRMFRWTPWTQHQEQKYCANMWWSYVLPLMRVIKQHMTPEDRYSSQNCQHQIINVRTLQDLTARHWSCS